MRIIKRGHLLLTCFLLLGQCADGAAAAQFTAAQSISQNITLGVPGTINVGPFPYSTNYLTLPVEGRGVVTFTASGNSDIWVVLTSTTSLFLENSDSRLICIGGWGNTNSAIGTGYPGRSNGDWSAIQTVRRDASSLIVRDATVDPSAMISSGTASYWVKLENGTLSWGKRSAAGLEEMKQSFSGVTAGLKYVFFGTSGNITITGAQASGGSEISRSPDATATPISGATYGVGASLIDVTNNLKAEFQQNRVFSSTTGMNQRFGQDPAPNVQKMLRISVSYNNINTTLTIPEHLQYSFSKEDLEELAEASRLPLSIEGGNKTWYGIGGPGVRTSDILNANMATYGHLYIPSDPKALHPDLKVTRSGAGHGITMTYDGQEFKVSIPRGKWCVFTALDAKRIVAKIRAGTLPASKAVLLNTNSWPYR